MKDQVGTVYKVFNETTRVMDTMVYDTFGNLVNRSGSSRGNLAFQGKYYDSESGLYYFYHRYYNPSLGRFMTEDPIGFGGGLNFFGFVNNDPVNFVDPLGLISMVKTIIVLHEKVTNGHGSTTPTVNVNGKCTFNSSSGKYHSEFTFKIHIVIKIDPYSSQPQKKIYIHEAKHMKDWLEWYDSWYNKLANYEDICTRNKKKCEDFANSMRKEVLQSMLDRHHYTTKHVDGWSSYIFDLIMNSGVKYNF